MRTKAELTKAPDPGAPPPGIRITSGRTKNEIGRILRADGAWTAFARETDGRYRPLGAHPDFAAALSAIPDTAVPAERDAPKPAASRSRRPAPAAASRPEAGRVAVQSGKPRAVRSRAA